MLGRTVKCLSDPIEHYPLGYAQFCRRFVSDGHYAAHWPFGNIKASRKWKVAMKCLRRFESGCDEA